MTLFLSFRTSRSAGSILDSPQVLEAHDFDNPVKSLPAALPPERIAGREIVLVTHGFNVSFDRGVRARSRASSAR